MRGAGGLALAALTAGAVFLSARAGRQVVVTDSPQNKEPEKNISILEVMGLENVTEALTTEPGANSTKRGIRNNNPLNIEKGDDWLGLDASQTDPRFAQFIDARYGFRAATRIVGGAYRSRGVDTLAGILGAWAPKSENDLRAYIDHVSNRSGILPMQTVTRDLYPQLFEAMTLHENGEQPYTLDFIREGVSWA
ncbi:hypothetical protein [uncultured Microbulbifer sp.]|uniref:hypothetical protein n=1 Tax=uncultured Microbulbifer sp. TaxID=348147 RepID=UPI0025FA4AA4|nr:hypothetical protein [uncultured Microbulbifer sp.]